jgi:hypothetical protein
MMMPWELDPKYVSDDSFIYLTSLNMLTRLSVAQAAERLLRLGL